MSRDCIDPTEIDEKDPRDDKVWEHPAFGQISLSRLHGGRNVLYGSDFVHHNTVRITVKRSQLRRGLSRDWHSALREVVSLDLSEAQWATFVSSFGIGEGTPCTLNSIEGRGIPRFPLRDSGQEYKAEVDAKLAECLSRLQETIETVKQGLAGVPMKKTAALVEPLLRLQMELQSNLPFVAKSLAEHMEQRVEKAKVEVNAYMTSTLMRAGLDSLQAEAPLLIEHKGEK